MELLASNQPWNLITYMAIPVILAETIAITELYLLFTKNNNTWVKTLSAWAGSIAGIYFFGIFLNLFFTVVVPLTQAGGWRGIFDVIAVSFYLLGVIPLSGIALLETGLIKRKASDTEKQKLHAIFVAIFLVVAHVAMIFGMLNPELIKQTPEQTQHMMPM